jgi:hypothetical protein
MLCGAPPAWAELESYYLFVELGLAEPEYPGGLEQAFAEAEARPGGGREQQAAGIGIYWPSSDRALIGFAISAVGDSVTDGEDFTVIELQQLTYGVSMMRFRGEEPGAGLFLRADVGLAETIFTREFGELWAGGRGWGALVGIGYGFAVTDGTRLLLGMSYAITDTSGTAAEGRHSTLAFTIGGLF